MSLFQELETQSSAETRIDSDTRPLSKTLTKPSEEFLETSEPVSDVNTPRHKDTIQSQSEITPRQPSARPRKRQKRRFEAIADAVRDLNELNEKLNTPTTSTAGSLEDECEIMGKHIAIQLRQLPAYDRVRANFEIQKILMEFRLRNISPEIPVLSPESVRPNSSVSSILLISNPGTPQTYTNTTIPEPYTSEITANEDIYTTDVTTVSDLPCLYND